MQWKYINDETNKYFLSRGSNNVFSCHSMLNAKWNMSLLCIDVSAKLLPPQINYTIMYIAKLISPERSEGLYMFCERWYKMSVCPSTQCLCWYLIGSLVSRRFQYLSTILRHLINKKKYHLFTVVPITWLFFY